MKLIPFRCIFNTPKDVFVGMEFTLEDGGNIKVTRIKSVKFLNKNTIEVIGLGESID